MRCSAMPRDSAEFGGMDVVTSPLRTWVPLLAGLHLLAATSSYAAPYVVEGMTLGARIELGTPNYRSYKCGPIKDFKDYTWCERKQPRRTGGGSLETTIMHAEDGTAVYLDAMHAPIAVDRASAQKEIEDLSKAMNERPTRVEWVPAKAGVSASVIATWGRVELRKLEAPWIEMAVDNDIPGAIVIDAAADMARSAKAGLAIYRIGGGAGFVYTASFGGNRGHRRYVAIDISQPALRKFEPAILETIEKDQSLAADDYSLWPEVASVTRNLSLEASPTIANEALDKALGQSSAKKLRSRVWSLLPLGSIPSLADRAHWTISVYGPKTQYPEIRQNIQKFLAE